MKRLELSYHPFWPIHSQSIPLPSLILFCRPSNLCQLLVRTNLDPQPDDPLPYHWTNLPWPSVPCHWVPTTHPWPNPQLPYYHILSWPLQLKLFLREGFHIHSSDLITHSFIKINPSLSTTLHHQVPPNPNIQFHPHPLTTHKGSLPCNKPAAKHTLSSHLLVLIPTRLTPSPSLLTTNLTWCANSSELNVVLFILEKWVRCSQNAWMTAVSCVRSWSLMYQYQPTPKPTSSLFRDVGPSGSYTNSLMPPRPCSLPVRNGIPTCPSIQTIFS